MGQVLEASWKRRFHLGAIIDHGKSVLSHLREQLWRKLEEKTWSQLYHQQIP